MLSDLQQLLSCRRERENRAAAALRQARLRLDRVKAEADGARVRLEDHLQDKRERQDKLYRRSMRGRLSKQQIDDLNIELDLMAEETDALAKHLKEAEAVVDQAAKEAENAAARYRQDRQVGDRWGHLVDDVADAEQRRLATAEEFAIEDDLGDRRVAGENGLG